MLYRCMYLQRSFWTKWVTGCNQKTYGGLKRPLLVGGIQNKMLLLLSIYICVPGFFSRISNLQDFFIIEHVLRQRPFASVSYGFFIKSSKGQVGRKIVIILHCHYILFSSFGQTVPGHSRLVQNHRLFL